MTNRRARLRPTPIAFLTGAPTRTAFHRHCRPRRADLIAKTVKRVDAPAYGNNQ
jgi:hypothetical protein